MLKLNRYHQRYWLFIAIDIFIFSVLILVIKPYLPTLSTHLIVNMIMIGIACLFIYRKQTSLFDYYLPSLKVACLFIAVISIYCVITAQYMIILPWILLIMIWLCAVNIIHWVISRYFSRPISFLDLTIVKNSSHAQVKLYCYSQLSQKPLSQFDALIIDPHAQYDTNQKQLILNWQTSGKATLTPGYFEEFVNQRVSDATLQKTWVNNSLNVSSAYVFTKHILDVTLIFIFSPLICLLIGITILMSLIFIGHPIFFTQLRIGRNGKIFKLYKFRTMTDPDKQGETYHNEGRVTSFGNILRKFRLDELPQFWNIIKGDMSLIGPRPEWVATAKQFRRHIPAYHLRHLVRPGITGWAQVMQGHTTGIAGNYEKLKYDIYYIKYLSLWLDIKIMAKTVYTVLTHFGAK